MDLKGGGTGNIRSGVAVQDVGLVWTVQMCEGCPTTKKKLAADGLARDLDAVWHRDSHEMGHVKGGVHKLQIFLSWKIHACFQYSMA